MASPLDGVMTKRKTSKRLSSKMRSSDLGSLLSLTIMKCFIIKTSRVWKSKASGELVVHCHTDAKIMALLGFECARLQLWFFLVSIHDHVGKIIPMLLQFCGKGHCPPVRQRCIGERGLQGATQQTHGFGCLCLPAARLLGAAMFAYPTNLSDRRKFRSQTSDNMDR